MKKIVLLTGFQFLFLLCGYAQEMKSDKLNSGISDIANKVLDDFKGFDPVRIADTSNRLLFNTPAPFRKHPDFGIASSLQPPGSIELIDRRTVDSKTFLKPDGSYTFKKSSTALHYMDENGWLRDVIPHLIPTQSGWSAAQQNQPKYLFPGGHTEYSFHGEKLISNKNVKLNQFAANNSNYTVGKDGMYITDAWSGIDIQTIFREEHIETEYVIKHQVNNPNPNLEFSEEVELPAGWSIRPDSTTGNMIDGSWRGELGVYNFNNEIIAHFATPVFYDSNEDPSKRKGSVIIGSYRLAQIPNGYIVTVIVPVSWVNDPSRVYPVFIDPTLYGQNPNIINSCGYPGIFTFNLGLTGYPLCAITTSATMETYYTATNGAWMFDGYVWLTGPCADLHGFYFCPVNSPGTCYVGPVALTISCLNPWCASTTLNITEQLSRDCIVISDLIAGCGCNSTYIYTPINGLTLTLNFAMPTLVATTITNNQTICYNTAPLALNMSGAPSLGGCAITYQWQSSSNNVSWTNIGGATGTSYSPPVLTANTYYRLCAASACGNVCSSSILITVNPQLTSTFTASPNPVCAGSNATITYTGNGTVAGAYTWNFAGGTIVSGSGMGPYVVNWSATGAHNVTLSVTQAGCTSALTTVVVTVNPVITSTFTVLPNPVCVGVNTTITYTGTGTVAGTYTWNFAGGTIVSGSGIGPYSVNWSSSGIKNVTLSVTQGGCTSTLTTVAVTVNPVPTSTFTVAPNPLCAGANATVTYTGTGIVAATYNWSFGGATIVSGSGQGPYVVSWPSNGVFNVTLTVIQSGCTSTLTTVPVTVNPVPTSTFTASPNPVCAGSNATITYTGSGNAGATYTWGFGGATIISGSGQGPYVVSWPSTGTFNVTLTVLQSGCTSTLTTIPVVVNPVPTSTFTVSPNPVCAGSNATVTYTGTGNAGATYNWSFGGATIISGSGQGPYVISWPSNGVFNITLTVIQSGCTSTLTTVPVTVNPVPTSTFTVSPNPACAGSNITITYTGTGNAGATYTWGYGGATIISGSGQGPYVVSWPGTGTFNVTLTVLQSGCTSTLTTIPVVVNPVPTSTFTVSPNPVCVGSNATVTYTGSGNAGATYNWNFGGATIVSGSGQGPYLISWPGNGTFNVTLSVTQSGCISAVTTIPVIVNPAPTPSFTVSPNPICFGQNSTVTYTGTASGAASYTWNFGSGSIISGSGQGPYVISWPISGATNITFSVTESGCISTITNIPVTINPLPVVSINPIPLTICVNASSIILTGNPAGGIFSGTGVAGNNFNPATGVGGPYTITYTYTDANTCTNTATASITVLAQSVVSINPVPATICVSSAAITLTGNPTGGVFSGTGVIGNSFDPASASVGGPYTITYSYTDVNGCSNTATANITVVVLPTVNINPIPPVICINAAALPLSGTPAGGIFSGTGVVGNNFNPATAGVGGPYTITYTYTDPSGCTNSATTSISVAALPVVSINPIVPTICVNTASIVLIGNPAGGTFSGTGVLGNNFNPSTAGVGGPYTITYSYTDANGCSSTTTATISVVAQPIVSINPIPATVCINSAAIVLTGNPAGGTFSGTGVSGNNFNPSTAGIGGPYIITYSYTDANGCSNSTTTSISVVAQPILNINAIPVTVCVNAATIVLVGNPAGGTFSGTGVSGNNFNPATAGVGGPYTITYSYTDANGCSNTTTTTISVVAQPIVSINALPSIVCVNGGLIGLSGNPSGGTFSGTGVSGNAFNPPNAGVGGPYTITYSYTDANGCTNTATTTISVVAQPVVTINAIPSTICINAAAITLTGNPVGGTFTGTGVIGNSFNPATAGIGGPYTITYSYTDANGCSNSNTTAISVVAQPIVSINAIPTTVCVNAAAITLTGNPAGGAFSGTGVSGNNFNPATAGIGGPYTIAYSYTDANGCTNSTTTTISVVAQPIVSINAIPATVCVNAAAITLTGNPAGGTFSGTGVTGNNFTPSTAGISGPYTITYSYTDANGCSNSTTTSISVVAQPIVSINAIPATICVNAAGIALTGNPAGGTFSGTGVVGNNFTPSTAGVGGPYTITYSYTDPNGCSNSTTTTISVVAQPIVSINAIPVTICVNAAGIVLTGNPAGGIFSGTGVSGNNFNPATAGVGGPYTITYSYTDANGCSNSSTTTISVVAQPIVSINAILATICVNAAAIALTGNPAGGTFSGTGVSGNNFNPATAGVGGPYTITYSYTDANGCTNSTTTSISVIGSPVVNINAIPLTVCINGAAIPLTGNPAGGTFSGTGVVGNTFDPATTGVGGPYTITYSYTDPNGCSNSTTTSITVIALPIVSINAIPATACINGAAIPLVGNPAGGTFSGTGVSGNNFDPATAGIGGTYTITYSYTDANGCSNLTTTTISVVAQPTVSINAIPAIVCSSAAPVPLVGNPVGGTFSGTGVSGNNFNPATAGIGGPYTITYSYTDANGCSNSTTTSISVNGSPVVSINAVPSTVCINGAAIPLTGNPAGGTFSGTGVVGNTFDPATAGVGGPYTITYSYTDPNGCSNSTTTSITVVALPVVSINAIPATACINGAAIPLTGNPAGGTFSGTGVSANNFDPVTAGIGGPYTITYSYTDANGCSDSTTTTISVVAQPIVSINAIPAIVCSSGAPIPLVGNPAGGTFSGIGVVGNNFDPPTAGIGGPYTITYSYTDANGCTNTATTSISVLAIPLVSITPVQNTICINATTIALVGNPAGGIFSGTGVSGNNFDPAISGVGGPYTLTYSYTNAGGCSNAATVSITVVALPVVSINAIPASVCENAAVIPLVGNPSGGTFSGTGVVGNNFDPVVAGIGGPYTITYTYTDANSCTNSTTTSISVTPLPVVSINALPDTLCLNAAAVALVGNPSGGTFSGTGVSGNNFDPATAGVGGPYIITYTYTDANGCSNSATDSITVVPSATVNINAIPSTICLNGGTIALVGNPSGGTFSGTGVVGNNFDPPVAGAGGPYTITYNYNDPNGCTITAATSITVLNMNPLNITPSNAMICLGASVVLQASGGVSYTWSPATGLNNTSSPSVIATPLVNTMYYVNGTGANGCAAYPDSVMVFVDPGPVALFTSIDLTGCEPLYVQFQNLSLGGVSYTWLFGNGDTSQQLNPAYTYPAGNYDVTLITTNVNGCSDTIVQQQFIHSYPMPVAGFTMSPDTGISVLVSQAEFTFTNTSTGADYYSWDFGDGLNDTIANPVHQYITDGEYTITLIVTTSFGCADTASLGPAVVIPDGLLFVPNAFTPNGDGVNDLLLVYGSGYETVNLIVFDRWGNKVFDGDGKLGWDGTFLGQPMNTDVYIYMVNIVKWNGRPVHSQGDVTLIR